MKWNSVNRTQVCWQAVWQPKPAEQKCWEKFVNPGKCFYPFCMLFARAQIKAEYWRRDKTTSFHRFCLLPQISDSNSCRWLLNNVRHPSFWGVDRVTTEETDFLLRFVCLPREPPPRAPAQHCCGGKGEVKATQLNERHLQEPCAPRSGNTSSGGPDIDCAHSRTYAPRGGVLPVMDRGWRGRCNRVSLQWLRSYSCRV